MRQPLVRLAAVMLSCLALGGCGVKVKTARTGGLTSSSFDGEWVGTWQPAIGVAGSGGPLTLRLQQFQGQPVVAVQIDNPCVTPREYELLLRASSVELRADGQVVFGAVLDENRTLLGTYQCAAGTGSWSAVWQRALPPIVDLSGTWAGSLVVPGGGPFALECTLTQSVRAGSLVLDGTVLLPELLLTPIVVTGSVQFREGAYDLVLRSVDGAPVQFALAGIGGLEPLRLQSAFVQFFGPTPLPFSQGLVDITRQTPP